MTTAPAAPGPPLAAAPGASIFSPERVGFVPLRPQHAHPAGAYPAPSPGQENPRPGTMITLANPSEEPMFPPDPFPPPPPAGHPSPAHVAASLTRALTRHGITGIYTATAEKFAIISVTAALTVWTNGHQIWCTHEGQRHTWDAAEIEPAAARLAALARPASS